MSTTQATQKPQFVLAHILNFIQSYEREYRQAPTVEIIAYTLGLSIETVREYLAKIPESYNSAMTIYSALVPQVMEALFQQAMKGNLKAAKLFLDAIQKHNHNEAKAAAKHQPKNKALEKTSPQAKPSNSTFDKQETKLESADPNTQKQPTNSDLAQEHVSEPPEAAQPSTKTGDQHELLNRKTIKSATIQGDFPPKDLNINVADIVQGISIFKTTEANKVT